MAAGKLCPQNRCPLCTHKGMQMSPSAEWTLRTDPHGTHARPPTCIECCSAMQLASIKSKTSRTNDRAHPHSCLVCLCESVRTCARVQKVCPKSWHRTSRTHEDDSGDCVRAELSVLKPHLRAQHGAATGDLIAALVPLMQLYNRGRRLCLTASNDEFLGLQLDFQLHILSSYRLHTVVWLFHYCLACWCSATTLKTHCLM